MQPGCSVAIPIPCRPKTLSFLITFLVSISGFSATAVIPPSSENQSGAGGGNLFTSENLRYQIIYNAAQFAPLMPEGGEIREIAFRLDETLRFPQDVTIQDFEVRMSSSPSVAPVFPHPFSSRVGSDETVVFGRGSLRVIAEPAGTGPNPFSIIIPLTLSFGYNPANGDLVVDIWVYKGGGNNSTLAVDAERGMGSAWAASILSPTSDNPAAVPILRLNYIPVPEPTAWVLIVVGFLLFTTRGRLA